MADLFESGVTYGEKSWHGKENNLAADDLRRYSVDGTMAAAGMEWTVAKLPLAIAKPRPAIVGPRGEIIRPADSHSPELAGEVAAGAYGVFRTDRWECLATVGEDYQELQNRQIFQQFQPFLDCKELSFESAGSLAGGKKVYVQARLNVEAADIGGGDRVDPMLLIASSHDGSLATRVGFTPVRVVCANTLAAAVAGGGLLKIKHTRGQGVAMEAVMDTVDLARRQFVANCDQYRKLIRCGISRDDLARYVKQVLGMDESKRREEFSTRTLNQYDRICQLALRGKGQSPGELTLWSAYNGVTEWTSHYRQTDREARKASVWFGASATTNSKALDLALSIAG
jgi:phage/plasmid-like protein (TIGR03299 family)